MADDAILVEGLEKSYGSVRALCGVSFSARSGSVLGLLGPNGAGKTTAVRILATLLKPDGGSARVAGLDVVRDAAALRAKIGLAGQYAAVDENLTGFENLEMVGRLYHLPRAAARDRAGELLERFDLTEAAKRPVKTYSGGMRRRLDLAAALVFRPPVLFLDEPTTGLDPRSRLGMWETIEGACGGRHDRAADNAIPRRSGPARGPDRGDRPRHRDRRRHFGRAQGPRRRRAAGGPSRACRGRASARSGCWRRSRTSEPSLEDRTVRAPLHRRSGVIARGGAAPRRGRRRDRRHRAQPADARRRVHRPHRPRRRGGAARRGDRAARGGAHEFARDERVGHAGAREAQPDPDPAPAGSAGRLHDPAGDVRAAVRLRVRRRDRLRGVRLRRLPDAGHHRPVDRVRRVRDRPRARPRT